MSRSDASFSDFFEEHRLKFGRACVVLTGSVPEGEDLAQEAMARVFERWGRVAHLHNPEGYLYRTALNLHRNALRRAVLAARLRVQPRERDEDLSDRRIDALRAIRTLPRPQREAVFLVEWIGYTSEEAAGLLGIKGESVRGRLHRARKTLREIYGDEDD